MINTDIERAARALCTDAGINPDGIGTGGVLNWMLFARQCKIVLSAALSEPSEEMVLTAARAHCNFPIGSDVWESSITDRPYRLKIMCATLVAVGKLFEGRTG